MADSDLNMAKVSVFALGAGEAALAFGFGGWFMLFLLVSVVSFMRGAMLSDMAEFAGGPGVSIRVRHMLRAGLMCALSGMAVMFPSPRQGEIEASGLMSGIAGVPELLSVGLLCSVVSFGLSMSLGNRQAG